jgi:glutamine amidotransferase
VRAAILDCGVGNLHSLSRGLEAAGYQVRIEAEPLAALSADCLVLPGVGAFPAAAARIAPARQSIRERLDDGLPCLAICLGMQLLFDGSEEGPGRGLGLVPGTVTRLGTRRVPHMGWNGIDSTDPVFSDAGLTQAWFAHSFVCRPHETGAVIAWSEHESQRFPAAIRTRNTLGVQFHPEKSAWQGIATLAAFRRSLS